MPEYPSEKHIKFHDGRQTAPALTSNHASRIIPVDFLWKIN